MIDKFSQALTLMREAFADAQTGSMFIPSVDLAAEVDGAQQVINAASAVQALRVAQYAGREQEQDASGAWVEVDHGLGHVSEFAADALGPMLAMGSVAAGRKVDTAAVLASRLPVTLAAMSAGDLDWWRATIIATELAEASRESCAAVEALIYPAVLGEAPGAVTRRVRRVLGRVDADAVRVKAAKERLDLGVPPACGGVVHAYPSQVPGLTTWVASLPAAESAACWAAIDDLAHQMAGDDPTRTLGQCRADALVDLMLTNATVTTTVTLMIPVQTATVDEPDGSLERDLIVHGTGDLQGTASGADGDRSAAANGAGAGSGSAPGSPAEPPGQHRRLRPTHPRPEPADRADLDPDRRHGLRDPRHRGHRRRHRRRHPGQVRHHITRVLLDERTGVVIETSLDTYRPNRAMRRFIQKRDGHCRFPGCTRNAKHCEPDHIIPYSQGGPTAPWNLASLCKHHHRVKHQAGWTLTMTRDGDCTWTDPHDRQYATHPTNHHELAA